MIIQDARLHWKGAASDPEGYRERYKAAYNDFGKHPYSNRAEHSDLPDRVRDATAAIEKRYTINLWAAAGQMYLFKL